MVNWYVACAMNTTLSIGALITKYHELQAHRVFQAAVLPRRSTVDQPWLNA